MIRPVRIQQITRAGLALGLVAVTAGPVFAADTHKKERPWPTQDDAPVTANGCESMGKGYMKMPGTDTCIRISGYVRSEGAVLSR